MFSPDDLSSIALTLRLACVTTLVLLILSTPLAWWLATSHSRWRAVVEGAVALPLVLPPTVLGFYLLVAFGPHGPLGQLTQSMGLGLMPFTFTGLVIGSVLYSLPFAVQPIQQSFEAIGPRPMEVAATLRSTPLDAFLHVALPLARPGFYTAAIVTFAHTLGEFGVVLMIGGNIPGQTRVVSMQIYGYTEAMEFARAHVLSGAMVLFSMAVLVALSLLNRRRARSPFRASFRALP